MTKNFTMILFFFLRMNLYRNFSNVNMQSFYRIANSNIMHSSKRTKRSCNFVYFSKNWIALKNSKSNLIYANNQKIITLFENFEHYKRTKHIVNKWHWIRQTIEKNIIQMKYVFINFMIANNFTKSLNSNVFQMFLNFINMIYWLYFFANIIVFLFVYTQKINSQIENWIVDAWKNEYESFLTKIVKNKN